MLNRVAHIIATLPLQVCNRDRVCCRGNFTLPPKKTKILFQQFSRIAQFSCLNKTVLNYIWRN